MTRCRRGVQRREDVKRLPRKKKEESKRKGRAEPSRHLQRVPEPLLLLLLARSRLGHGLTPLELGVLPREVDPEERRARDRHSGRGEVDEEGVEVAGGSLVEVRGEDVGRVGAGVDEGHDDGPLERVSGRGGRDPGAEGGRGGEEERRRGGEEERRREQGRSRE
jgi:hypothetical protein